MSREAVEKNRLFQKEIESSEFKMIKEDRDFWMKEASNTQNQLEIALKALVQIRDNTVITGFDAYKIALETIEKIRKMRES